MTGTRIIGLIATLAALLVTTEAQQAQNANQAPNQPPQQTQPAQPSQQAQPTQQAPPAQAQKKSVWQRLKDASQQGQAIMQQGTNTVQQGTGTVQQTGQQVQNGVQQVQGSATQGSTVGYQGINGAQQAVQQNVNGVQQGMTNAFQPSGGGSGACGPSCFDAGTFQANVSQMTLSQEGGWHIIRMNIQFHNSTNQPLIIAYHDGSMVMVDNNGASYVPAGGNPGQLQGMGIDRGNNTDSQFQLGPGQTGYALFSVARGRPATSPVGTSYAYNLTIDELQLQNGAMAIPVRTYNLNFPSLAPGTSSAAFTSGPAASPTNAQSVAGRQPVGAPVPQTQNVNGRQVTAAPTQGVSTSVVNHTQPTAPPGVSNAAMKTPANTTQVRPAAPAAKPIPAQTLIKQPVVAGNTNKTTTPPKKPTPTATTTSTAPTK